MHSRLLYHFITANDDSGAQTMLNTFDDIDILYEDGDIIRILISKNQH
jgi:hypothetical protein